ncbi:MULTISPECIES: enterochelin esterase [unclassified Haematobacter]|uniref:enterochelin esterase n=1 Tax=unclassified Haematobacter TaxID=2640585 RepID=UPI0025BC2B8A|nr:MULTISPECIES: enterochelin esterase [unclassified Haematobacter]
MVSRALPLALLLTMTMTVCGAQAQELLHPGATLSVDAGGGPVSLRIAAPPGSYIAGRISGAEQTVTADLLREDGSHFRRLAEDCRGDVDFQAMTEGDAFLRITSATPVAVRLDRVVPPGEQIPPERAFLSPRIAAMAESLSRGEDTEAFWREVGASGTPLVEDAAEGEAILTFLWRAASRNVRLFGGPSNDHEWLERLDGSDIWFKSFRVPDSARLSYKLAPDVPDVPGSSRVRRAALLATAQADPLNRTPWPATAIDRFNQSSTVTLKNAPPQPGTPTGTAADPVMARMTFHSDRLGNSREITLSHPRGMDPRDPRLAVAFIFDGEAALEQMQVPDMLDRLAGEGRLPPVLAVLIPSIDGRTRARELPGNDGFADALADELLPQVAARMGILPDPARTVLAGASYGGLAAATVALRRPEVFGNVLSMSGSFWWAPDHAQTDGTPWMAAEFADRDRLPLRFFLSAGTFETARPESAGIFETSRELRDILRLKGYDVGWRAYAGGHDYLVWRGALADGLIALFGK